MKALLADAAALLISPSEERVGNGDERLRSSKNPMTIIRHRVLQVELSSQLVGPNSRPDLSSTRTELRNLLCDHQNLGGLRRTGVVRTHLSPIRERKIVQRSSLTLFDHPKLTSDEGKLLDGEVKIFTAVSRREHDANPRLAPWNGRERDRCTEDVFGEQALREIPRCLGLAKHHRRDRCLTYPRVETKLLKRLLEVLGILPKGTNWRVILLENIDRFDACSDIRWRRCGREEEWTCLLA